jgi:hypothetical protein
MQRHAQRAASNTPRSDRWVRMCSACAQGALILFILHLRGHGLAREGGGHVQRAASNTPMSGSWVRMCSACAQGALSFFVTASKRAWAGSRRGGEAAGHVQRAASNTPRCGSWVCKGSAPAPGLLLLTCWLSVGRIGVLTQHLQLATRVFLHLLQVWPLQSQRRRHIYGHGRSTGSYSSPTPTPT